MVCQMRGKGKEAFEVPDCSLSLEAAFKPIFQGLVALKCLESRVRCIIPVFTGNWLAGLPTTCIGKSEYFSLIRIVGLRKKYKPLIGHCEIRASSTSMSPGVSTPKF